MSIEKMHANLAAVVAQKITDHPGYPEFESWCQSQLMPASQIYFLVWQAARDALLNKQAQEQEEFIAHLSHFEPEDTFHG